MITAALVGLGRIGMGFEKDPNRLKPCTHLGALRNLKDSIKLTGICDIDPVKLEQAIEFYGSDPPLAFLDIRELLTQPYDLIVLATPANQHRVELMTVVTNAQDLRPKLVFCEKPIFHPRANYNDMIEVLAAFKDAGIAVAVNHSRRWASPWVHLKNYFMGKPASNFIGIFSGGHIEVGVHMADLANWYSADHTHLVHCDVPYVMFELELIWPEGAIRVKENGLYYARYEPTPARRHEGEALTLFETYPIEQTNPMLDAYKNLLGYLDGSMKEIACTGEDGLKAVQTLGRYFPETCSFELVQEV